MSLQKMLKLFHFPSDDKSEHQTQGIPTTDRTLHFAAALALRICLPPMMKMTQAWFYTHYCTSYIIISDPTEIRLFEYTSCFTQAECQNSIIWLCAKVGIKATDLDLLSTEAMKVGQMNLLTSSNVIHELNQFVIIYSNLCLKPVQLLKLLEQIQFTNI